MKVNYPVRSFRHRAKGQAYFSNIEQKNSQFDM